jgi:hypothetical protein
MNTPNHTIPQQRDGLRIIMSAYALASLPQGIREAFEKALSDGATIEDAHQAAAGLVNEAPVSVMQCVVSSLIFLANPGMSFANPVAPGSDKGVQHG